MPARSTASVRSAVLFGIDHMLPLCFLGKFTSQRKQRADAAVAQVEAQPKQNPETELDVIRVADAHMRGDECLFSPLGSKGRGSGKAAQLR